MQEEKKRSKLAVFFDRFKPSYMVNKMKGLGFNYTSREMFIQILCLVAGTGFIGFISKLDTRFIVILCLLAFLCSPTIIISWFNQAYNLHKFTVLQDYLTNIVPIFMRNTKIYSALHEVEDLVQGEMKQSVKEAIAYLDDPGADNDMYTTALSVIEKQFPNSRVMAVHRMMINVEKVISKDYESTCTYLMKDVDNYIKRIQAFQHGIKSRRNQLILLCAITLVMNSTFSIMFANNEYFAGFEKNLAFQVSNMVFIASVLIVIALMLAKLHGRWLIEDMDTGSQEELKRYYDIYRTGPQPIKPATYIMIAIFIVAGIYFFTVGHSAVVGIALMASAFLTFWQQKQRVPNAKKQVAKYLHIEFPTWLREVSLNLRRKNVYNALKDSRDNCGDIFKEHVDMFLEDLDNDPISIRPYNNFLAEYNQNDIKSTMKVLYSVSIIGVEQMPIQIDSLIVRNQEMLQIAEEEKNKKNLSSIEMLGYVPMVLFSANMVVSMVVLVLTMMNQLNAMMG